MKSNIYVIINYYERKEKRRNLVTFSTSLPIYNVLLLYCVYFFILLYYIVIRLSVVRKILWITGVKT